VPVRDPDSATPQQVTFTVVDPPYTGAAYTAVHRNSILTGGSNSPTREYQAEPESSSPLDACTKTCTDLFGGKMPDNKCVLITVGVLVGITAVLIAILLPLSYAPLEYYQYGFRRRTTTGSVDVSHVYGNGGRHLIGPDHEFKVFPADAHFENFVAITVFAADRLQVTITCSFQYFLRPDQMHLLHNNYDIHYRPVLRNNALDAIKGASTEFTTRDFIHQRDRVKVALFNAVRERLGGTCCEDNCGTQGTRPCYDGCRSHSTCSEGDMGLFAEVRYFQLLALRIPDELNQRYLQALILVEEQQTEELRQEGTIIRKDTDRLAEQFANTAREVSQNATATSTKIHAEASAKAQAMVENARSDGLKLMYTSLNIDNSEQRASFDYLRTLRTSSHVSINVNFKQLVAMNGLPQS